jgi:hypothetical protein
MRHLLIGTLSSVLMVAAVALYFWAGALGEWDPNNADLSQLAEQRHMAECYQARCGHVSSSPVLACAWRQLILHETGGSLSEDVVAAENACRGLSPFEHAIVERAEEDIRAHLHVTRHHG